MRRSVLILAGLLAAGLTAHADGLWVDVPFVKQVENGCGAAVLSMTIEYWQRQGAAIDAASADAAQIQSTLYSSELRGIAASAMARYLEGHGFQAVVFRGRWDDLREQLAKGRPLIVAMRSGGAAHYAVVAGVSSGAVEMNDPAERKLRKMGRVEFEKKWRSAGNWTLLAVPRSVS